MIRFQRVTKEEKGIGAVLRLMPLYYEYDGLPYEAKVVERALRTFVSNEQYGQMWLIQDDTLSKEAIGYIAITFGFTLEFGGHEAFVDELFILEEFRGQGVGSKAIDHAIVECKKAGVHAIRLEVTRDNTEALRLYKKLGFEDFERCLLTKII
jgi:ribosomal protein S18 acetylase RimI-like enzyme